MGLGVVGVMRQRTAEAGLRGRQVAPALQGDAQVVVGLGIVGIQLQCPAVAGHGLVEPLEFLVGGAEIGVEGSRVGIQLDGPADVLDRDLMLVDLRADDAQQVPGVGIAGIGLEDLAVNLLGLLELARPMKGDGLGKGFRNRGHGNLRTRREDGAHRMIRLDRKNLPVDVPGSLQPAALMVLDRNRE